MGINYRERAFRAFGKRCARCAYSACEQMLDVHHRDGNRESNNTRENLEVLCVWCHALETRKITVHGWNGLIKETCKGL